MSKRRLIVIGLSAALALGACSKKEEPAPVPEAAPQPSARPEMPPSHPPAGGMEGGGSMGMGSGGSREIVMPDEVKSTWKAVVLEVTDKDTNTTEEVTVDIGESAVVGDVTLKVEAFLPAFTMSGGVITSLSAETDNPAARLVVEENGNQTFAGWLFSMHPDAHPMQHPKYSVLLKDFVKK